MKKTYVELLLCERTFTAWAQLYDLGTEESLSDLASGIAQELRISPNEVEDFSILKEGTFIVSYSDKRKPIHFLVQN